MAVIPLNENPSRIKLYEFVKEASQSVPVGSFVLDAGAGEGMYRPLFEKMKYFSVDLGKFPKDYGNISAVSNLTAVPFSVNCFDLVICTQVLEHVNNPKTVLSELWRVLKPEGFLWLSAPFFFEQHEIPYDYFRYTTFGLKYLLESENFYIHKLEWLEGYYGTLAYQLETAARFFKNEERNYMFGLIFKLFAKACANTENNVASSDITQPFLYGKNLIAVAKKLNN